MREQDCAPVQEGLEKGWPQRSLQEVSPKARLYIPATLLKVCSNLHRVASSKGSEMDWLQTVQEIPI